MPRHAKPLTEVQIRHAKPDSSPLWDGGGLHLLNRNGHFHWRLKYVRPDGRENRLALGAYPTIGLKDARALREAARRKLAAGIDPAEDRKAQRADAKRIIHDTFEHFAREWLATKSPGWAEETRRKAELCVDSYLVPTLGKLSVRNLTSADVLKVLRGMAAHSPSLTPKVAQAAQAIVRVAITEGAREDGRLLDLNLRDNLPALEKGHYPAATLPAELGKVLRLIATYPSEVTRAALFACAYTGQRPGVVVAMRWEELSNDGCEWIIPAAKMKMGNQHIVPITRQVRALLDNMHAFTGGKDYVFPPLARQKTPHLHRDALSKALREAGLRGKQTPHGLRASLRTLARERLGVLPDVLEAQLAHAKKGEVAGAYDRTRFDDERRNVMQQWADYLDDLRDETIVARARRPRERA
ncbi:MAG: integrase arm-type DNA-binding domain-containing protein [Rhodanobacter sp.]